MAGVDVVAVEDPTVGVRVLLGHDLDAPEQLDQPRAGDLGFLVGEVALGDDHQLVAVGERLDGVPDPVEQLHGVIEHDLGPVDDRPDVPGRDLPVGDLDGRLDHGQREALHPVAEAGQVGPFPLEQAGIQLLAVDEGSDQGPQPVLGGDELALAVPQRVVPVERDHPNHRRRLVL
jgi:hypothetical protein